MPTTPAKTQYPCTYQTEVRLGVHPRVSGRFALDKNLWQGRKVAAVWIGARGNYRTRTSMKVTYGTLDLTAGNDKQFGIVLSDGQVWILAVSRVTDLYDMTRTKEA